ncbi:hypothetical protein I5461_21290, partial [Citrobacter amalonaticus]
MKRKEFKLTTMALLISSLLMANNAGAVIHDVDGIISGSGIIAKDQEYKIISTAGENNTISVANNGGVTITNPGGTPTVSGGGEFENGDFLISNGTVIVANSGTINLGSGTTVNHIIGDVIPGTVEGRPDIPLDNDYQFMYAVGIVQVGGNSAAYLAQKGSIVADNLTINMSQKRDGKDIAGILGNKHNGVFTLTGTTTVNSAVTGANGKNFAIYAKSGSKINAENLIVNSKGTFYAVGLDSESSVDADRSLIRYKNATITSVADQYADGISSNGADVEALGDTAIDVTVNDANGVISGIWVSDGLTGVDLDAHVTMAGKTSLLLKSGAESTVLSGVESVGASQFTSNDLNITLDTQGHQQTTGTGIRASKEDALTAGKIDINGRLNIDVIDTTRSGSWKYVQANKGGEITLNGEVQ